MPAAIDLLPDRLAAALLGAAAGEAAAGTAAGTRQLLDLADSIASRGGLDEADLVARGLDTPPATGAAGLVLRATACGLASPLDRPRLRRDAHRSVRLAGGDEGTAITAVAAAVLAADLCRFDLDLALVRLRQTLLEVFQFAALRQAAKPQQVASFFEGGMFGKFVNVNAAIGKDAAVAIDITNAGVGGDDAFQALRRSAGHAGHRFSLN